MSTVQDRKGPGAGTKVDLGENAPTTREGAGVVPSESLAAESYQEGGEFADNRETSELGSTPRSQGGTARKQGTKTGGSYDGEKSKKTQQQQQHQQQEEGGGGFDDADTQDGLERALRSEPGSLDDPGRLAEQNFQLRNARPGDSGARQGGLMTGTRYDMLDREEAS